MRSRRIWPRRGIGIDLAQHWRPGREGHAATHFSPSPSEMSALGPIASFSPLVRPLPIYPDSRHAQSQSACLKGANNHALQQTAVIRSPRRRGRAARVRPKGLAVFGSLQISECKALTAASRLSTGTNKFTECGDKTYLSAIIR